MGVDRITCAVHDWLDEKPCPCCAGHRFTIGWNKHYGAYTVSIPNYEGGEVVRAKEYDRLQAALTRALEALRLFAKYAPQSGDMALLIRASQGGGDDAAELAARLVLHYAHLDEAHDKAFAAMESA